MKVYFTHFFMIVILMVSLFACTQDIIEDDDDDDDTVYSNNADLSNIALSDGVLSPAFTAATQLYTATVAHADEHITLSAGAEDAQATIQLQLNAGTWTTITNDASSDPLALKVGANILILKVTAEDDTTEKLYTITINREADTTPPVYSADLDNVILSAGVLSPAFTAGTQTYTTTVAHTTEHITLTTSADDAQATIQLQLNAGTWATITNDASSDPLTLKVGVNILILKVTAEDDTTEKLYTITINREADTTIPVYSKNLSALSLSAGVLNPVFNSGTEDYTMSVVHEISALTVTATAEESENVVITTKMNNGIAVTQTSGQAGENHALIIGGNTLKVTVTASDNTSKTYTITIVRAGSSNAKLSELTISVGTLSPVFSPDTLAYSAIVDSTDEYLIITPTAQEDTATIVLKQHNLTIQNPIHLLVGDNTIDVDVTAEDDSTNTYVLVITRKNYNADLSNLVLTSGTLSPEFTSENIIYSTSVPYATSQLSITATAVDAVNATLCAKVGEGEWHDLTGDQAGGNLDLSVGINTVQVKAIAEDTNFYKIYVITVTREKNNDADLSALQLSKGTLSPVFSPDTDTYTVDLSYLTSSLTFTPTASDARNASIQYSLDGVNWTDLSSDQVSGDIGLTVGNNTIRIKVTAHDDSTKTYTLTVNRAAASSNANLSTIAVSDGTLRPPFYKERSHYQMALSNDIGTIAITPETENSYSVTQVRINEGSWMDISSGQSSQALNLNVGVNTLEIKVNADDGSTVKTYTVAVQRETSSTQSEWVWQNPLPQANTYYDTYFLDVNRGWAVGDNGAISATSDGGATWVNQNSGTGEMLKSVYFIDSNTGWIVGGDGTLLKTSNGGATWTALSAGSTWYNAVYFGDGNTGWIAGEGGVIKKTTDGGATWSSQTSGTPYTIYEFYFSNTSTGWAVGYGGMILHTSNGGDTWTAQTSGTTSDINSVSFIDSNTGWCAGKSGTILTTSNGGTTWTEQTSGTTGGFTSVFFIDSNTGWVLGGSQGGVLKTTNGGSTWTDASIPSVLNMSFYALHFTSATTGYIVGDEGFIYKTTNGGNSWTKQSSGVTYSIRDSSFIDGNTGWFVGEYALDGVILHTTNGGDQLTSQLSLSSEELYSIDFVDENNGFAVGTEGSHGYVVKTTDGGANWTSRTLGSYELYSVKFTDNTHGWTAGTFGDIYYTDDAGVTWTTQTSGTSDDLFSIYMLNNTTGWICGENGTIIKTTDGGTTWTAQTSGTNNNLYSIYFISATTGWAVGSNKTVLKTTDGGITWTSQTVPSYGVATSVYFIDENTGWMTISDEYCKTTNGGQNWTSISLNSTQGLGMHSIYFTDSQTGWIMGARGIILKSIPQ